MDWHFSVEINTSLYQTWNLAVLKNKNKTQLLDTEWEEIFQPVSYSSQGEKKRKEEPEERTAMAASQMRKKHWGHFFSKREEVFISSTRAQQEETKVQFNKTLILKTRVHQLSVRPHGGCTANLTLAELADTKSKTWEEKVLISWAMIQWARHWRLQVHSQRSSGRNNL